jgi:ketosteroid isomerase-like protein
MARFDGCSMSDSTKEEVAIRKQVGEDIELDFRLTIDLRKIDNQWIVLHEHHSIPAVQ